MFSNRAAAAVFLLLPLKLAAAPPEGTVRLSDHGKFREFVVARDEIAAGRTVRKIPVAGSAASASATAAAEPNGELVLYPEGAPRTEANRRLLTKRVAVQLAAGTDAAGVAARAGATVANGPRAGGWYVLQVAGGPGAALEALPKLRGSGVLKVETLLARQQQRRALPPPDPLEGDQWHLGKINAQTAWASATGNGVRIGIVDDGLQHSHPDLIARYDAIDSYDFNGRDADPEPPAYFGDDHGTACAGLAAATRGNGLGVTGVAFNARLAGLRLISFPTTDEDEADAFAFHNDTIDIKSNSWGPPDGGLLMEEPGPLAVAALEEAVEIGRGGRGTVFLFAAGNGAELGESANSDGYSNRREAIAVAAISDRDKRAPYSERGANVMVCAPSDGGTLAVTTVDRAKDDGYNFAKAGPDYNDLDYTKFFGGTSAACPIVAGVAALVLERNPALGWRDVQEILIRSASQVDPEHPDWITNGAGLHFNHSYGAGLVDAAAAVALADGWANLGPERKYEDTRAGLATAIPDGKAAGVEFMFNVAADRFRIEHVALTTSIHHARRGELEITLTSPNGTTSKLAELRPHDRAGQVEWSFTSVHHWGELAKGDWKVKIADRVQGHTGTVQALTLTFWGASPHGALEAGAFTQHDDLTSDFAVTNRGSSALTNVAFTLILPDSPGQPGPPTVIASIAPGETKLLPVNVFSAAPVGTILHVFFTVAADGGYSDRLAFDIPIGTFGTQTFSGEGPIALPSFASVDGAGKAGKYVTKATVSGLPAGSVVFDVKLHLAHFVHRRSYDLDALLVSPSGGKVLVMGDAGGSRADDVDLVLTDSAELPLPDSAQLFSGTYRPANYGTLIDRFPSPAPPRPYGFSFSTFAGSNPTGDWQLFLNDDATGGYGSIANWSLEIIYLHP